ncbi:MAG: MotA/TolQ/ExbB proton channel family protein [Opitutaceae bacterium]
MHANRRIITVLLALAAGALWGADEPLESAVAKARLDAAEHLKTATAELTAVRARVAAARAPLAESTREAEARLARLESELVRLETEHAKFTETRDRLRRENDAEKRNLGYLLNQAQESMKSIEDALLPGERGLWGDRLADLRRGLDQATAQDGAPAALATADFILERIDCHIGGCQAVGQAVAERDNRILPGRFVYVGPETFFRADSGEVLGPVALRPGGEWPMVYDAGNWSVAAAGTLFADGPGLAPLDASAGKALALRQRQGTFLDQMRKGGVVGYAILAVGVLALAIAVQKLFDFRRLAVDEPPAVRAVLAKIAAGSHEEALRAAEALRATTRELFLLGLRQRQKPKAILEEHLESFVLQQRMLQERRLPLLAVIATSGPLLGLLGTVTGMIKTFTLITVFGTGSAGKLSAGISEALIATKFGLMVAIPALVVHGFLSQRIQKHIAMLERYALEISTANEEARRETRKEGAEVR